MAPSPEVSSPADSDSVYDPLETLRDDIRRFYMKESKFERKPDRFFPCNRFTDVFSGNSNIQAPPNSEKEINTVLELLSIEQDDTQGQGRALASYILGCSRKIFLIAIYAEIVPLHTAMILFKDNKITDSWLPFEVWPLEDDLKKHPFVLMEDRRRRIEEGKRSRETKTKTKRIWSVTSIDKFQVAQWEFQAPVISTNQPDCNFRQCAMPFTAKGGSSSSGAHGTVCRYEVHPAHYEDHLRPHHETPVIAVKAFKKSGQNVALDWEREVNALARMNELKQDHIVRFITAFRRGEQNDLEHYVVFEWAEGGNLGTLWDKDPKPKLSASRTKWAITQLHGLAKALAAAHYLEDNMSYRHGDLKPANILWFHDGSEYGTLKIGDWGEAKIHKHVTALRHNTTAKPSTMRYEPPETALQASLLEGERQVRSRLYDIWSFGCITLEFIIWLMYGRVQLRRFNDSNHGEHGISDMYYEVTPNKSATVHGVVKHWMQHMANDDLCRPDNTALGDLLRIVRTGLLIVQLPHGGGSERTQIEASVANGSGPSVQVTTDGSAIPVVFEESAQTQEERWRATHLELKLRQIVQSIRRESYWYQTREPRPPPIESGGSSYLSVPGSGPGSRSNLAHGLAERARTDYGQVILDPENWTQTVDNEYAETILSKLQNVHASNWSQSPPLTRLCAQCQDHRERLSIASEITCDLRTVQENANSGTCDLCCLLWQCCKELPDKSCKTVRFLRAGSTLMMSGVKHKGLALFQDNDPKCRTSGIQIGLPKLPKAGEEMHLGLIRGWLDDCDRNHDHPVCKPVKDATVTSPPSPRLPTRLIDVGNSGDNIVRLQELQERDTGDWVALSYRWGPLPHFSTTRQNLRKHIAGMPLSSLPRTFRHAVKATRALGQRYLWIDSICIIQGDDGDFGDESKKMEHVYSGAYCVLAASCATDQQSGFFLPRVQRKCVTLKPSRKDRGTIYVCEMIENFREHVLQGALNKRGWGFARTCTCTTHDFFHRASNVLGVRIWRSMRDYGKDVQLMATSSGSAALLGDPNFPKILNPAKHGERILRFQELYQQYSRLDLSSDYDRPTAIDGLQQRLLRTMNVYGGFGVLDDRSNRGLLRRSLLWHRGDDTACLNTIRFPDDRERMPSWSWMSRSGGIDYFSLKWNGFDWQDLQSPWPCSIGGSSSHELIGKVQALDYPAAKSPEDSIIFDDPYPQYAGLMVIVLGIEKVSKVQGGKLHYVLVVQASAINDGVFGTDERYTRIGAGRVRGHCLTGEPERGFLI